MPFSSYIRILCECIFAIPSIDEHNDSKRSIIKTISN